MPNWTEDDYVKRAAEIADHSFVSKKPLNDVCVKAAQDDALNPEEIRTLVRLSNVAMFQRIFKQKASTGAPDRHVDFDVGDPEAVIQRLHAETPPQSANIMNDKLAGEIPDMMAAKRRGFELDETVTKVASDDAPRPMKRDVAIPMLRKLAEEFDTRRLSAGYRWEAKMDAVRGAFNKAPGYGPDIVAFEKDAFAELGDDVMPEMGALLASLGRASSIREGAREKLSEFHLVEATFTKQLALLKEACDARADYEACVAGEQWALDGLRTLEG